MKKYILIIFLNTFLILSSCSLESRTKAIPELENNNTGKKTASCPSHGRTAMTKERTQKMLCD